MNRQDSKTSTDGEEFVPQMKIPASGDRRKVTCNSAHYTDAHWHISKAISAGTLIALALAMATSFVTFRDGVQEIKNLVGANSTKIEQVSKNSNGQIKSLNGKLDASTHDRITRETVLEMFKLRDVQIKNLADQMRQMQQQQAETNKLLTNIYREMPRAFSKPDS